MVIVSQNSESGKISSFLNNIVHINDLQKQSSDEPVSTNLGIVYSSSSVNKSYGITYSGYSALNTNTSSLEWKDASNFAAGNQALPTSVLEDCRKKFVRTASSEQIEYGYGSASENLLDKFFEVYKQNIGFIVQHIYVQESGNPRVTIPLLKAVSNLDYLDVYPFAQMMAIAALANADPEVREAGIRAFENWASPDGIVALTSVETPWPWLNTYRLDTIAYLEGLR